MKKLMIPKGAAQRLVVLCVTFPWLALLSGCQFDDRLVYLREYRATLGDVAFEFPEGLEVALVVEDGRRPESSRSLPEREPLEPPQEYDYRPMVLEDELRWEAEFERARDELPVSEWNRVGTLRGGFGNELAGVYSLSEPTRWLAEALTLELGAQGIEVVPLDQANVRVTARLRHLDADMMFNDWAYLTVDLYVHVGGRFQGGRRIRVAGGQPASRSPLDSARPYRICLQQLAWFVLEELEQEAVNALARSASLARQRAPVREDADRGTDGRVIEARSHEEFGEEPR